MPSNLPTPAHAPSPACRIDEVLARSNARLHRRAALGDGLSVALWSNQRDAMRYQPTHHTLSLYLQGGQGTFREDAPQQRGAPGKLCLMPAGHVVDWVVGEQQQFLHLYFAPERLGPLALRLLDCEPREVALPELNFADDPVLARLLAAMAALDWATPTSRLRANELGHAALAQLLTAHSQRARGVLLRGGLAPSLRRRLADWLQARLAEPVTVGEMAAFCALSEHHFAHAFRISFGCAPHAWLAAQRLERAADLLRGPQRQAGLEAVAVASGHASASHLVRRFRAARGVTPGQYRAASRG